MLGTKIFHFKQNKEDENQGVRKSPAIQNKQTDENQRKFQFREVRDKHNKIMKQEQEWCVPTKERRPMGGQEGQ